MKILVADDSKTTLRLIEESLHKLGHDVVATSDGAAAIEAFNKGHPDLIILDVVMEGMDGFECARRIRQLNTEDWIPIIFLSSSVDDASIAEGINAGGDDYLAKPFSDVTLQAKIKAMQRIAEMRHKLILTTEKLETLSSTDTLTGLYNRFQYEKTIQERLASVERHNRKLALLFIDIDHFKTINDVYGHHIGDLLLTEVAERIKKCTRMEDFVARIGGDEFVVILSDINNKDDAENVARKIVLEISWPFNIENNVLRIGASIGVAFYPEEGVSKDSITRNADTAMYEAKEHGRNNYLLFTKDMNERHQKQVSLETELNFALDRKQLQLCYQPIYHLITKKIIGMEALLRWNHPEYGSISPNVFIPIAEETGLIHEIGEWAMRIACEQGQKWREAGFKNFKLAVNMSLLQILDTSFVSNIKQTLQDTRFAPDMLDLELTESTLITYTKQLKDAMLQLRKIGIGISVDDFGTRYTSLTSLQFLPVTTLKIDKDFMTDVNTDQKNAIIVKSLIALGSNLNLNIIAEGVETEEQAHFLVINNCEFGQGYLYSKPISADDFTALLQSEKYIPAKVE